MKVLVTGASGKIGRLVVRRLVQGGHDLIGIDRRPWPNPPAGVDILQADVRKRDAEELFRRHRPHAVVHMATVTHLKQRSEERYRINLLGTRAVFDHAHRYGSRQAIFVGRHTYYGAAADAPLYHREDDPPLAVTTFPELADLVAADLYAGSTLWRLPELQTTVLRLCYSLGPAQHGTLASYLRGPRVPTVLGYDPLFQFLHEQDMAEAICTALEKGTRGVFNVAGPAPLPLSLLIRATGRMPVPIPAPLFRFAVGRLGLPPLPPGAVEHVKYPVVIDDTSFREATGFSFRYDEDETMAAFRTAPASG